MSEGKKPREVTIRVFKLLPFEKQECSVAAPGQIEWKDQDVNFEYVPMIEKSAYDKAIQALKKINEDFGTDYADGNVMIANEVLRELGEL